MPASPLLYFNAFLSGELYKFNLKVHLPQSFFRNSSIEKKAVSAFVLSRLNYYSSLFVGLLDCMLRVQNNVHCIVFHKRKGGHSTIYISPPRTASLAKSGLPRQQCGYTALLLHSWDGPRISDAVTLRAVHADLFTSDEAHLVSATLTLWPQGLECFSPIILHRVYLQSF